ncbi:MAG: hypothetical protein K2J76_05070 [Oscillospiraceae bacterium]|nr:hypothetical protein [Oscillospiraceae bacterium]
MKKSALAILAAVFALSLSSCGTPAAEEQVTAKTVQTTLAETAAEITESETETTTTTVETTSETTETTTTVTATEKVCTCESEFQHACCEYLNGLTVLVGGAYFGDINGDDTPEAVIAINPFGFTEVLYENENGMRVLELETVSQWGAVQYFADTKQILFCPMVGHTTGTWGYEEYYIYDWDGLDYDISSSIFRESGYYYKDEDGEEHYKFGQAYIDGKKVDNDTFEARLAEIRKLREENGYFPIIDVNDENFESYMKENFPCFDNWGSLPVKQ